ncbi:hypothetical protein [Paenarthrobacter sp. PH39-S1]|uniref:hypothetical protein n=1 Tax=Paenarthrobacter sp. PH39-S1 TaxID=3046204 RepID=UPI0024B9ED2E|nr:hypothetical protein [Paenarthrobacter sp. PH39-S1]MDJ0356870.1 hypothetical protein [Paenarthrobacter sp. PH39-S1]
MRSLWADEPSVAQPNTAWFWRVPGLLGLMLNRDGGTSDRRDTSSNEERVKDLLAAHLHYLLGG